MGSRLGGTLQSVVDTVAFIQPAIELLAHADDNSTMDEDCLFVWVLSRTKDFEGIIDGNELIPDPFHKAARIFQVPGHTDWDVGLDRLKHSPVRAYFYHNVVRDKLLSVCRQNGLYLKSFKSYDDDEVFLKVFIDIDGEMICKLAQRYQYRMPLRAEVYSKKKPVGNYEGHAPMKNADGHPVPAYQAYTETFHHHYDAFRTVDALRLVRRRLSTYVNLDEMVKQEVILLNFPAENKQMKGELNKKWASFKLLFRLPTHEHDDLIRNYFGEEIAFFFMWFTFYIQALVPLGILGLICSLQYIPCVDLGSKVEGSIAIFFNIVLVVWAACFTSLLSTRSRRRLQQWGMNGYDTQSALSLESYNPELEGTWRLWIQDRFVNVTVLAFCALFVLLLYWLTDWRVSGKRHKNPFFQKHGSTVYGMLTTALIQAFFFMWGRIAPKLVELKNPRTNHRRNEQLTIILSSVKLFCGMLPFIQLAFVKKYSDITCGSSLESLADHIYEHGPPLGVADKGDLAWLEPYSYRQGNGDMCIYGCFPAQCKTVGSHIECRTNCMEDLLASLSSVYVTHTCMTIFYLLVPIVLVGGDMADEVKRAPSKAKSAYSILEMQAKRCRQASYKYYSWGGSYVEDFLEEVIGFAYLTTFGPLLPMLSFFALVCSVIEYRLLAFRMTNITCRPFPAGAEGIRGWQTIFEFVSVLSAVINSTMNSFVNYPFRNWDYTSKLQAFITAMSLMVCLKSLVHIFLPGEAADVKRVEDFNEEFKRELFREAPVHVPPGEIWDYSSVDISVDNTGVQGQFTMMQDSIAVQADIYDGIRPRTEWDLPTSSDDDSHKHSHRDSDPLIGRVGSRGRARPCMLQ